MVCNTEATDKNYVLVYVFFIQSSINSIIMNQKEYLKEKLIKAMQLIATEENYIRNGYSLNDEDAAALAEANDLLNEILSSVN